MKIKIENTAFPKEPNVGIEEMSITYIQSADTNDDRVNYQRIKISTVSVPCCEEDGEEPPYYFNFEILPFDDETPGHWSVEHGEELLTLFNDFFERLKHKHEENKDAHN